MGKELYRVRKSWDDSKSQIGAFASLKKAISTCEEAGEAYKVYSSKGTQMFPREKEEEVAVEVIKVSELVEETKEPIMVEIEVPEEEKEEFAAAEVVVEEPPVEEIVEAKPAEENIKIENKIDPNMIYRVRKLWSQPHTQLGKFTSLEKAIECCMAHGEFYKVYDPNGEILYPGTGITAADLDLKVGDKVTIQAGAKYPSGISIADYVLKYPYYIIHIKDNGIVSLSKKKNGEFYLPINGLFLEKIEEEIK